MHHICRRRCHFDHNCSQNDPVHPAQNDVGAGSGLFPLLRCTAATFYSKPLCAETSASGSEAEAQRGKHPANLRRRREFQPQSLFTLPTASNCLLAARSVFPPRQGDVFIPFRPQEHLQFSQPRGGFHISRQTHDCAGRSPAAP